MLSRRERLIVMVMVAAVGLGVLDYYVLSPLYERQQVLAAQNRAMQEELEQNLSLVRQRRELAERWREMVAGGLGASSSEAESRLLNEVRGWSQGAGLTLGSLRPERVSDRGELREVVVSASATGSLRAVSGFLHSVENSAGPIRVKRIQIDQRGERAEELTVEVQVSTLYRSDEESVPARRAAGGGR